MEKSKKDKVEVLKEVVNRNKIRNNGTSIDKMVSFLRVEGIEAKYCPPVRIEGES